MMEKNIFKGSVRTLVVFFALIITGCASVQKPVELDLTKWQANETEVAILVKPLPKPYTHKVGSQGLLDVAINNATASGMTKVVSKIDLSEFYSIKTDLSRYISDQNVKVTVLEEDYKLPKLAEFEGKENFTKVDYRVLKDQLKVDQLLVVEVTQLGTVRNYYGFIPTSLPRSSFVGVGQLIDLSTNEILWHNPVFLEKSIQGKWDEKGYPNVIKAIKEVTNSGKEDLVSPFIK